jgi:hypothetical protein
MNQVDNINEIYINNFNNINNIILDGDYLINNYLEPNEVIWEIDRNHSNFNILNSLQNTHYNYDAFNINIDQPIGLPADDEFIPFEPESEQIIISEQINIRVEEFPVLEEDNNCCICIETREISQICQLNCFHKFCYECTLLHMRRNIMHSSCPLCRTTITNITVRSQEIRGQFI